MNLESVKNKARSMGIELIDALPLIPDLDMAKMFRTKCEKNLCGHYDTSWTCPPGVGTPEKCVDQLKNFNKAVILIKKYTDLDMTCRPALEEMTRDFQNTCRSARKIFVDNGFEVKAMGEGPCRFCLKCTYPEPCPHPDEQLPSMSGYGIDMEKYIRSNGMDFSFSDHEATLYGVILFR